MTGADGALQHYLYLYLLAFSPEGHSIYGVGAAGIKSHFRSLKLKLSACPNAAHSQHCCQRIAGCPRHAPRTAEFRILAHHLWVSRKVHDAIACIMQ